MDGMQPRTRGADPCGRNFFAGFTFSGDQNIEALAGFYGLPLPALDQRMSVGHYLTRSCYGLPRPGYRIALGHAELCVLEVEEGVVTRVGLRLLSSPASRGHQNTGRYPVGATLVRSAGGINGAAAQGAP